MILFFILLIAGIVSTLVVQAVLLAKEFDYHRKAVKEESRKRQGKGQLSAFFVNFVENSVDLIFGQSAIVHVGTSESFNNKGYATDTSH